MDVSILEPPDSHHLSAAAGWLGLGCPDDARAELAQIDPGLQHHPAVLDARWMLCAYEKNWAEGTRVASTEMITNSTDPAGWLHYAYAIRRDPQGGLPLAHKVLVSALERFPQEPVIPYNLACYACQMQQLDLAREWFQRALSIGDAKAIRAMALADADLQPLWPEIKRA